MNRVRKSHRGLWIAGGIFLCLILAILIGPRLVPTGFARREITKVVRQKTGLTLRFGGPVRLSIFPTLGLTLRRTTLENPKGFQGPPLLFVGHAAIGVGLIPLVTGHIVVTDLRLNHIALTLMTNRKGQSNYEPLVRLTGPQKPATPKTKQSTHKAQTTGLPFVALGQIQLRHVTISDINQRTGKVDHVHLREVVAGPIKPGRYFPFLLKAGFSTSEHQSVSAKLELKTRVLYRPRDGFNFKGTVFNLTLTKPRHLVLRGRAKRIGFSLSKKLILINKVDIQSNGFSGFLSAKGRIEPARLRALSGYLKFKLDRIKPWFGRRLDHLIRNGKAHPPLTLATDWHISATGASLSSLAIALGSERLTGFARVGLVGKPRHFSFLLDGNSLALNPPPTIKLRTPPKRLGGHASGRLVVAQKTRASPHTQSVSWLHDYSGTGHIHLGALHVGRIMATGIALNLRIAQGVLTAAPLSAQLFGGRLAGSGSLSAGPGGVPKISLNLNLHHLSARQLLAGQGSRTLSPLAGTFDASLVAHFTGENKAALARTLTGHGTFSMHKARWVGLDLDRVIGAVRQALAGHIPANWPQGGVTPLGRLQLNFRLAGPIFDVSSLDLETPGLVVTGRGPVDWPHPKLALRLLLAPRANTIGRREWPAALHGIKIPITVSGPPNAPRVVPDLSAILKAEARAKAQSLLGRFLGHLIHHG